MDELPHRTVIDFQTALAQRADKAAKGEGSTPAALDKPAPVIAAHVLRPVATHFSGDDAARRLELAHPFDNHTRRQAEPRRHLATRQAVSQNRLNDPRPQIH